MKESEELALMLRAALPVDDVDQLISPDLSFVLVWIDISERPDLQVLTKQEPLTDGYSVCTWFYAQPEKRNMRIGVPTFFPRTIPAT
jgi:hypothetical protein